MWKKLGPQHKSLKNVNLMPAMPTSLNWRQNLVQDDYVADIKRYAKFHQEPPTVYFTRHVQKHAQK